MSDTAFLALKTGGASRSVSGQRPSFHGCSKKRLDMNAARIALALVLCAGAARPLLADMTLTQEPSIDGKPLSSDSREPTVLEWAKAKPIGWQCTWDSGVKDQPKPQWWAEGADGKANSRDAGVFGKWHFCAPADVLEEGTYKIWVTVKLGRDTLRSKTYYIAVKMPPVIETKYHTVQEEFLGRLARLGRTAFKDIKAPNSIVDAPQVWGCDNPSMFDADGVLYFIFGDPNIYYPDSEQPRRGLSGAMAFTDRIVPEKGIDLAHSRNWVTEPGTGVAKSLIENRKGTSRVNNTGGAVLPHGDGKRLWFAAYDYGGPGKQPGYLRYLRVSIVYTDDMFRTPAVRNEDLVLWEKNDPNNGPIEPNPFLGYSMRLHKDHLYMMVPRKGTPPALIRCHRDELDASSLATWRYLVSVDEKGKATWSGKGITKAQISQDDFPTVDFGEHNPGIVNTVLWNPYMNRWVAVNALNLSIWEAKHLWGPYRNLEAPRRFRYDRFRGGYCFFSHDFLLGNNGEWIYFSRARTWKGVNRYGTFWQRIHLRDKLKLTLSKKCAVPGDTITITCANTSEAPSPSPDAVSVTVEGRRATFKQQTDNRYVFEYKLTGEENGGKPGPVDVAATMKIPKDETTTYHITRDVTLMVNHNNPVSCAITSHRDEDTVGGIVFLDVSARHALGAEESDEGRPPVHIIKAELRHMDSNGEVVEDADVHLPYRLRLDTTRYGNGPQTFKVVAYDTLDRRGEATIALRVENPPQPAIPGNLIVDGAMEAEGADAWKSCNGCVLQKVSGEFHRSGVRSLQLRSDSPAEDAGASQTVTGLAGGEELRFTAWSRLRSNYTAVVTWKLLSKSGAVLATQRCDSYGYFRRAMIEFDNPEENTEIAIQCRIQDKGTESVVAGTPVSDVEAIVDDVVLRPASHPLVEKPARVRLAVDAEAGRRRIAWDAVHDVNVEAYRIYRNGKRIAEVASWLNSYSDVRPDPAADDAYAVAAVDGMGSESERVTAKSGVGR